MSVAELKAALKKCGKVQTGKKADLEHRLCAVLGLGDAAPVQAAKQAKVKERKKYFVDTPVTVNNSQSIRFKSLKLKNKPVRKKSGNNEESSEAIVLSDGAGDSSSDPDGDLDGAGRLSPSRREGGEELELQVFQKQKKSPATQKSNPTVCYYPDPQDSYIILLK